jgi:hypothetical protein
MKIRTSDLFAQKDPLVAVQNVGGIMSMASSSPTQIHLNGQLNFRLYHSIHIDQDDEAKSIAKETKNVLTELMLKVKSDDLRVYTRTHTVPKHVGNL